MNSRQPVSTEKEDRTNGRTTQEKDTSSDDSFRDSNLTRSIDTDDLQGGRKGGLEFKREPSTRRRPLPPWSDNHLR